MAYIKKEPIIEFIKKGLNNPDKTKAYGHDAIEILTEIEYMPTADVVEAVRCRDCKHGDVSIHRMSIDGEEETRCYCELKGKVTDVDSFCSGGERREKNGNR